MMDSPGVEALIPDGVLSAAAFALPPRVLQFRQIVLWPVQLIPHTPGEQIQRTAPALPRRCRADAF